MYFCVQNEIYNVVHIESNATMMIMSHEVYQAISKLSDNKASGLDHISAEHLKYGSKRIAPLLALCFSGFMTHGVLPDSMLSVLLVPVIKDKVA